MKRKCSGCGERKDAYLPLQGGGHYCSACASSAGMKGHGPNRAEANSRTWKEQKCRHQAVRYSYESKWLTNYQVSHCVRCGVEVTRLIVGYHAKRR